MTRLAIGHVLSSFGVGGQERVALDLARTQLALGHRVIAYSIAPPPDGPLAEEFHAAGIETATVPHGKRFDPTLPLRLGRRFARDRIDVVHTHNPWALIYGAPAGRLARAIVVNTKHGANPAPWRRVLLRRAAAVLTDAYVAVSEQTARMARRSRDVAERKLRVISNGIDIARFGPDSKTRADVRAELGLPMDAWVVGTVGRLLVEVKNQPLLVRALAPFLGPAQRLVIIGDGPDGAQITATAVQAGVEPWVHLTGARKDIPRLLTGFDVFVLPSRTEGLPLVIPEAMATALPVVATAVGGIPEVIDEGRTGFLVPSEDEAALRGRLKALADDPAWARSLGATARTVASTRYSLERMSREYMDLYRALLAARD